MNRRSPLLIILSLLVIGSVPTAATYGGTPACDAVNNPSVYYEGNYAFDTVSYFNKVDKPGKYEASLYLQDSWNSTTVSKKIETDAILPEHERALNDYYTAAGFSEERTAWIKRIEKQLPLDRVQIIRVFDRWTGETLGTLRLFDGTNQIFHSTTGLVPTEHSPIPYVRQTGSKIVEELLQLFPDMPHLEIGKAFRFGSQQGQVAKAIWEVHNALYMTDAFHSRGYLAFIHTDKSRAKLYARIYGAKVIERLNYRDEIPFFTRQSDILDADPRDSEYLMVVHSITWMRSVYQSFQTDPVKIKAREESESLRYYVDRFKEKLRHPSSQQLDDLNRLESWIRRNGQRR